MKKGMLTLVLTSFLIAVASAQDTVKIIVPAKILGNDTIPLLDVNAVVIFPVMQFASKREASRYDKLVYNVRKVYPYAKLAGIKLRKYKEILEGMSNEKERKNFTKMAEKELEDEFGNDIRDLTFSQGKILIKLIYRETGNSSFEIVRELRGGFTAFIFQTLASLFGYNLKTTYDPEGEDQAIEKVVQMIEAGAF